MRVVQVGGLDVANDLPFTLIAGPCQIESQAHAMEVAGGAEGDFGGAWDRDYL